MPWAAQREGSASAMRVALVHDWLTGMRGGEWVLEEMCRLLPEAPIFTLVHVPGAVGPAIESHPIHTSFLQRLPRARRSYRHYLPLMPLAAEAFDLGGYDLVLSSSHCVAKGVKPPKGACHIAYLHTPMRYVWHLYDDYARGRGALTRLGLRVARGALRRWDVASSRRVDHFLANSRTVARRIEEVYGRPAEVIYPPVDTAFFHPADGENLRGESLCGENARVDPGATASSPYYLLVTALVPYKRVDIAVRAFTGSGRRLLVVGSGPEEARLRRLAGAEVEFLGWQPRERVRDLYAGAQALIFPGLEDFGMTPVESMACGRPVVAFGAGGVTETVRGPVVGPAGPTGEMEGTDKDDAGGSRGGSASGAGGPTGVFFRPQTPEALARAVREAERMTFDPRVVRARAEEFDRQRFRERLMEALGRLAGYGQVASAAPAPAPAQDRDRVLVNG